MRSGSSGEAGRPRLGRLVRVPDLHAPSGAGRALPRAQHPAAVGARSDLQYADRAAAVLVPVADGEPARPVGPAEPAGVRALHLHPRATPRKDTWSDEELDEFIEPLREPERARASQQIYRTFTLKEFPKLARGALRLAPAHHADAAALRREGLRDLDQASCAATSRTSTTSELELVPDTGHFIAEREARAGERAGARVPRRGQAGCEAPARRLLANRSGRPAREGEPGGTPEVKPAVWHRALEIRADTRSTNPDDRPELART